jgi:Ni/Fe-hydrogenase subunit HybB-like protein
MATFNAHAAAGAANTSSALAAGTNGMNAALAVNTAGAESLSVHGTKGEILRILRFVRGELRPRGKLMTPFNVVTGGLILASAVILYFRFYLGLGAVTNLSQEFPWGIWKAFNVVTGVAFAGGAYVVTFMVYVLRMEKYHPIVRVTVLNGLLAYSFYAGALLLELGRPWNVINPIIGNSFGFSSVLFLVAWHFMLYMLAQFVEFSPAAAEWLKLERLRKTLAAMTLGAVVLGITLSTLHQSGLGALFLMARDKIHPLWYTEYIPILFLISSIFAGLSMVIFEGSISRKVFQHRVGTDLRKSHDSIVMGLARICAGAMFVYLFMQLLVFIHEQRWTYLATGWGAWYGLEILGFVALPAALFMYGFRKKNLRLVRGAAVMTLLGIVLNRLNVSLIAYNWFATVRYVPTWMELVVSLGVISAQIWVFRWVIHRMPVLSSGHSANETADRKPEARALAA